MPRSREREKRLAAGREMFFVNVPQKSPGVHILLCVFYLIRDTYTRYVVLFIFSYTHQ